jgi:Tfp pilus assembly protein PilZ
VIRLTLHLADPSDWVKVFDPRGGGVFVPVESPPDAGNEVRVDLTITEGGPRVILKGSVMWKREVSDGPDPVGCHIGLAVGERVKINFINGYVRGGLLNRRERRRLPLRLPVTFGGLKGPVSTVCRDINEEGIFLLADAPLPEGTTLHMVIGFPGRAEPMTLRGVVSHTVVVEDEDVPGMGIRFTLSESESATMRTIIDTLEAAFYKGHLPEEVIT